MPKKQRETAEERQKLKDEYIAEHLKIIIRVAKITLGRLERDESGDNRV